MIDRDHNGTTDTTALQECKVATPKSYSGSSNETKLVGNRLSWISDSIDMSSLFGLSAGGSSVSTDMGSISAGSLFKVFQGSGSTSR